MRLPSFPAACACLSFCLFWTGTVMGQNFQQTNLASSATDPDLINPWGISSSSSSPFWVADNATGKATLYNTAGVKQGLIVTMPAGSEPITGTVFNGSSNFNGDTFLFASENGTIAGWRGALGTNAEQLYSVNNAVYKGVAMTTGKDVVFTANFHAGTINVFDSAHTSPIGSFADPTAPAGYAPFNIQNIGGTFYVTFALQDAGQHDDVAGAGHGIVDTFNPTTHTFSRLITGSAAGGAVSQLNSPWGLSLAPAGWGSFAGDLLVGNFGDGTINVFNPSTGGLIGTVLDGSNNPIVNPGLWGLIGGNGGSGGNPGSIYFSAGGADEDAGLFGRIDPTPEPASIALLVLGTAAFARRSRRTSLHRS